MEDMRKLELLKAERECVRRNSCNECDRNCAGCDLVQEDKELLEMYDLLIESLRIKMHWDKVECEIANWLNG